MRHLLHRLRPWFSLLQSTPTPRRWLLHWRKEEQQEPRPDMILPRVWECLQDTLPHRLSHLCRQSKHRLNNELKTRLIIQKHQLLAFLINMGQIGCLIRQRTQCSMLTLPTLKYRLISWLFISLSNSRSQHSRHRLFSRWFNSNYKR